MSDYESNDGSIHSEEEKRIVRASRSPTRSRSPSVKSNHSRSRSATHSPRYSRSRSRSRHHVSRRSRHSYSDSRSRSRSGSRGYRSRSRSSRRRRRSSDRYSSRRRHVGNRDHPQPNRCIGVFGMNVFTTENQIYHIFSKFGPVERVQVIIDAKTGRSRGFGFVYYENYEDAKAAKEECSGMEIDGQRIRVDFSITERAHTPTPGVYMGKPTYRDRRGGGGGWGGRRKYDDWNGGGRYRNNYRRRSPSPYYDRRRSRYSRSRSYSPRRKEKGIG
ncbi:transformer-2 protein homolog beta isoform X2 [Bemisia tabaci]|uniref:Transformer 2 isoform 273 n=4 Tax=Bemisia tabaci TaxID=7038 RepID=A0A2S0XSU3_BEMTA|nr:PREDICTED: transformer-2 protein homolog alpha-like isoform X1 [Bemisia tabaci]AWC26117.1 transformer 2 isoform 273 [Bemisia tabaci]